VCDVRSVAVGFEAGAAGGGGTRPAAVRVRVETSLDGAVWHTVRETDCAADEPCSLLFDEPAGARWVRLTPLPRPGSGPSRLSSVEVHGTCPQARPPAVVWTAWPDVTTPAAASPCGVPGDPHDADGAAYGVSDFGEAGLNRPQGDGTWSPTVGGWDLVLDDRAGAMTGAAASAAPAVDPADDARLLPAVATGTELCARTESRRPPAPASGCRTPTPDSRSWWYRREFTLPAGAFGAARDGRLWLEAEGIGHAAELWLNGRLAGALPHPFARVAYDVTELAGVVAGRRGPQVLAVRLTPTPHPAGPDPVAGGRPPLRCPDASDRLRNEAPSARALAAELGLAIRLRGTAGTTTAAPSRKARDAAHARGPLGLPVPDSAVPAGDPLSRVVLAHRELAPAPGRIAAPGRELRTHGTRFAWPYADVLAGAAARDGGTSAPMAPVAARTAELAPAPVQFAWREYATTITFPGGAAPALAPAPPVHPEPEVAARPAPARRERPAGGGHGSGPGGFGAGPGRAWWPADLPEDADTGLCGEGLPKAFVRAVEERMGTATSEAAFVRKARFVDYECLRAAAEAAALGPSSDADGDRPEQGQTGWTDAGRFGALKAGGPLHVQADPADGAVTVVNRTHEPVRGVTVTARLYDLGGRAIGSPVTRTVDAAPGLTPAVAVPFARSLPATHLLRLTLADTDGRVRSSNDYWRYRTPTDLRALNGLPQVQLSLRTRPAGPGAVTAEVANTGSSPAALVRLSLGGRDTSCADDNFLWLLPGESREVTLSWTPDADGGRDGRAPLVVAEAYNAPRTTA
jgi:hypothetical protein